MELPQVVTKESNEQQSNVDKNGEEILFEGISAFRNDTRNDACTYICTYCCAILFIMVFTCGLVIFFLPLYFMVCLCEIAIWKLYLTKDAIYHNRRAGYARGCCVSNWVIPLRDIKRIDVQGTQRIAVTVGRDKVSSYVGLRVALKITNQDSIIIDEVGNAREFVAAVKRQMARIGEENK